MTSNIIDITPFETTIKVGETIEIKGTPFNGQEFNYTISKDNDNIEIQDSNNTNELDIKIVGLTEGQTKVELTLIQDANVEDLEYDFNVEADTNTPPTDTPSDKPTPPADEPLVVEVGNTYILKDYRLCRIKSKLDKERFESGIFGTIYLSTEETRSLRKGYDEKGEFYYRTHLQGYWKRGDTTNDMLIRDNKVVNILSNFIELKDKNSDTNILINRNSIISIDFKDMTITIETLNGKIYEADVLSTAKMKQIRKSLDNKNNQVDVILKNQ